MPVVTLNYLAIVVAALAPVVVGFLWYGPLFGKQWMALMGFANMTPDTGKMLRSVAIQFVGAIIMACTLAYVIAYAGAFTGKSGLALGLESGFWMWLGFVAPVTIGMVLWEGKVWRLWFLLIGNWLVSLLLMGAILAAW